MILCLLCWRSKLISSIRAERDLVSMFSARCFSVPFLNNLDIVLVIMAYLFKDSRWLTPDGCLSFFGFVVVCLAFSLTSVSICNSLSRLLYSFCCCWGVPFEMFLLMPLRKGLLEMANNFSFVLLCKVESLWIRMFRKWNSVQPVSELCAVSISEFFKSLVDFLVKYMRFSVIISVWSVDAGNN